MNRHIAIATNNGDMGGGEVMLLNLAAALRDIGDGVSVIAPSHPGELAQAAKNAGFDTIVLHAASRRQYMMALFRWRLRNRRALLWCNGLVPSTATAGLGPRITELHILPEGMNAWAARLARLGSPVLVVPSAFMASRIPGAHVLENWTTAPTQRPAAPSHPGALADMDRPVRIGFLGRLVRIKGPHILAQAVAQLRDEGRSLELVVAGEQRFGTGEDQREIGAAMDALGDGVTYLGWVDRDEFFEQCDLAVFSSVFEEPFGLVAAEAMSAGVPFVISRAGGLPEVAGAEYPWMAEPGDAEDLARAITAALDAPAHQRERVVAASRTRWEQHFSPEAGRERVRMLVTTLGETP